MPTSKKNATRKKNANKKKKCQKVEEKNANKWNKKAKVRTVKTTGIQLSEGLNWGPPVTPRTSLDYGIEVFKGGGPRYVFCFFVRIFFLLVEVRNPLKLFKLVYS